MIETVVFDIDGTLADLSHRVKWIQGEEKDWDKFYDGVGQDEVIEPIADIFRMYLSTFSPSYRVVCITGRPERTHDDTLDWFKEKIGFEPHELCMRRDGDYRPDVEVKREWIEFLRREGHDIRMAFEDRGRVVKMYRELGIQCCQVAEGAY